MTSRHFPGLVVQAILCVFAVILFCSPDGVHGQTKPDRRPNIIFIFSDDHGAQAISSYGSTRNRTPNLDRLATGGMRFANCFCTNSICAPSRATVVTGMHTHITGHTTNERIFDTRLTTFPELLHSAGYQTAFIGKWHLNAEPKGFDYWDMMINQGVYYNPPMIRNGGYVQRTGYTTDIITDLTLDWLDNKRATDRPFLLMCHHKAPHREWYPPLRYLTMFEDSTMPEPPTLFDDWSTRSTAWTYSKMSIEQYLTPGDLHTIKPWGLNEEQLAQWEAVYNPRNEAFQAAKLAGRPLVKWKYQRYAKDYLRTVAAIDDGVGRILDYVDAHGLSRNTVVIYSSDQGWFLGEHGMFDKRWMYEETLRMPLLVRWPGVVPAGSVNTDLVMNLDFAQTFLAMAGVPAPASMQGRSLLPLLKGSTPSDWRKSVYYQFFEDEGAHMVPRHCGVRTDRYKLIHFYTLDEWEMYDLKNDPTEVNNVYGRSAYAEIEAGLKKELDRLRTEYHVTADADREVDTFQHYQQARWKFMGLLGRLPSRWSLDVTVDSVKELSGHRREYVSYAVGDEHVTAVVLVPTKSVALSPAIVALHGGRESTEFSRGKSSLLEGYALELCRNGFIVMCPDRAGFEGRQLAPAKGQSASDRLARFADGLIVNGSTLMGQELMEAWAAAGYLSRRKDVFSTRVGVLGIGEGGFVASALGAINEEILATLSVDGSIGFPAVLAEGSSSPLRPLLTVPGLLRWGDMDELLPLLYPRPFCELRTSSMPSGLYEKMQVRYKDLHMSERLTLARTSGGPHAIQRQVSAWFSQWLKQ